MTKGQDCEKIPIGDFVWQHYFICNITQFRFTVCIRVQSCQLKEFEKQQGGRVVGVEVVNIGQSTCPVKFIKVLK